MTSNINEQAGTRWSKWETFLFRCCFIYFVFVVLPFDVTYFRALRSIDWTQLPYGDIFNLARYYPSFSDSAPGFSTMGFIAVFALAGAFVWTLADGSRRNYYKLYYLLRVALRYRLAIAVIAYGMIKLFPLQAPIPSISNLNTAYGEFTRWKLFSMSLGIVPGYESFLGLVEITAGLLLLFRKTATIGAVIIIFFTGNVFISNLAYEGGEAVYSFYLISIALFLVAFDAARLFRLLVLQLPTEPYRFKPVFGNGWQKYIRLAGKAAFIFFFVVVYGFKTQSGYKHGVNKFPSTPGLTGASGLYDVAEFRVNEHVLPYSETDTSRWRDVVFENWSTVSIRVNKPVIPDSSFQEEGYQPDEAVNYELAGSGQRFYYSYTMDTLNHLLRLLNKNPHYRNDSMRLHYKRPDATRIVLEGQINNGDSVYVVLNRINKKYLLEEAQEGRTKAIKL